VLEQGIGMLRERTAQVGRRDAVHIAPRNLLNLTTAARGGGRAAFEGTPDEVVADIRRAQRLGCEYRTFDLPRTDMPGRVHTMERFVRDVRPAVG
jgi:alkanesulfonate monooxygenase SsuD/methylene tetrahydromethanopterin reductase-like flavin-dependent oxidoreductase (luciferase family)